MEDTRHSIENKIFHPKTSLLVLPVDTRRRMNDVRPDRGVLIFMPYSLDTILEQQNDRDLRFPEAWDNDIHPPTRRQEAKGKNEGQGEQRKKTKERTLGQFLLILSLVVNVFAVVIDDTSRGTTYFSDKMPAC